MFIERKIVFSPVSALPNPAIWLGYGAISVKNGS